MEENGTLVFQPLPSEITGRNGDSSISFPLLLKKLQHPREPSDDQHLWTLRMDKYTRTKIKKKQPQKHGIKKLTLTKRKELGLYKLGKDELKFSQMSEIHNLWTGYMKQMLNIPVLAKAGWNNSPDHPQFEQISLKLFRADYHGAILTVIKSVCPSLVACSGIVAMETKNCFKLVGKDDVTRTVPKKECQFQFELENIQFTFYGKNFVVRPAERSSKKVKQIRLPKL